LRHVVVCDWVQPDTPFAGDEAARFGPRTPIGAPWPADPVYRTGTQPGASTAPDT
jgi:hypothetical protein